MLGTHALARSAFDVAQPQTAHFAPIERRLCRPNIESCRVKLVDESGNVAVATPSGFSETGTELLKFAQWAFNSPDELTFDALYAHYAEHGLELRGPALFERPPSEEAMAFREALALLAAARPPGSQSGSQSLGLPIEACISLPLAGFFMFMPQEQFASRARVYVNVKKAHAFEWIKEIVRRGVDVIPGVMAKVADFDEDRRLCQGPTRARPGKRSARADATPASRTPG